MDAGARTTRTAADQLAIEQERASLALDAAQMGEFEWEMGEDRLIVSERMAEITGLPAGEMRAHNGEVFYRYVHPDDVGPLRTMGEALMVEGRYEVEFRVIRPDNRQVVWIYSAGVALRDAHGAIQRVIGVMRDITAKHTEDDARNALVAELDHRVKNVLASVQSLAAQS